jgi:hypothetical protein
MAFCIVNKGSNNSPKSYVSCNSTLHKDFIHGKLKENTSILSFILVGTMIKLKCIYHKLLLSLRYIHLNLKLGFCLTAAIYVLKTGIMVHVVINPTSTIFLGKG